MWQLLKKLEYIEDPFKKGALDKDERRLHRKIIALKDIDLSEPPDYVKEDGTEDW